MVKKSTLFQRTIYGVISLVEKSILFPHTFFGVISMVKKSTLFPRNFFDVISMVEKSTVFLLTFFGVILVVEKSTLFNPSYLNSSHWKREDNSTMPDQKVLMMVKRNQVANNFLSWLIWQKGVTCYYVKLSN